MSDADDLVAAGLYDADASDATQRLELLEFLLSLGASIPELVQADEEGRILSFAAFRVMQPGGERCTLTEVAGRSGITIEFALRVWRAAGFPDPRLHERRFSDTDVALFELMGSLCSMFDEEMVVQFVRTLGESTVQIAEAEIAIARSLIEAPLTASQQWADVARAYAAMASEIIPRVATAIDTLHRHHLDGVSRRYSDNAAPPSPDNVVQLVVGFADLAGYTGITQRVDAAELGALLSAFEATTGDLIAAAGASVVKRVGDAVMFVAGAPVIACGLALDLAEACARRRLPRLRIGLAFGEVIVRQGDVFGPAVNLAARLAAAAEPGVIFTDAALHHRLGGLTDRYAFHAAGRYSLAGFAEPVEAFQLLRSS